ncbi:hypothetical protein TVAG_000380 [Trichomonas vaginalis G3]|uniref:Uncharacterized protein n=1 Tax=Trichomonas vaginalis (strain ATCC PRA-98 / G3) TaxID=412133 RepID=A2EHR4_TRIV3|nr:hypothetical protein TVAG_000380 [Trichomonas vaginalis G3]|eukprot:XP_001319977.1 hypothetical protein [Trichomonas vaginalis G3]
MEYKDSIGDKSWKNEILAEKSETIIDEDDDPMKDSAENTIEIDGQELINVIIRDLERVKQDLTNQGKNYTLIDNLKQFRSLINHNKITIELLNNNPSLIHLLSDVSAESESVFNSKACMDTIWRIISSIPNSFDLLRENNVVSACIAKLSENANECIISTLYVLHYLVENDPSILDDLFEYVDPLSFITMLKSIEDLYAQTPEDDPESANLKRTHRLLLEAVAFFFTIVSDLINGENVGVFLQLIDYILNAGVTLGMAYSFYSLRHLILNNQLSMEDFQVFGLSRYINSALKTKDKDICGQACFLICTLVEKGYQLSDINVIDIMNYIKSISDKRKETEARECLALICEKGPPIIREQIGMSQDFNSIITESISRKDEFGGSAYIGDFATISLSGRSYQEGR